jgi:S-DNA-T family DNA segregation ATPase FtsK/SpoIIIE
LAHLLSLVDAKHDYSLHEPPVAGDVPADVNDNPSAGSACVLDLVRRYLALHPHERANMSVMLFNCDSARLPQHVVEGLTSHPGWNESAAALAAGSERRRLGVPVGKHELPA